VGIPNDANAHMDQSSLLACSISCLKVLSALPRWLILFFFDGHFSQRFPLIRHVKQRVITKPAPPFCLVKNHAFTHPVRQQQAPIRTRQSQNAAKSGRFARLAAHLSRQSTVFHCCRHPSHTDRHIAPSIHPVLLPVHPLPVLNHPPDNTHLSIGSSAGL